MLFNHFLKSDITLMLAHGQPPSLDLLRYFHDQAHTFIALDGASGWAINQGFTPHVVIGDLDSADPSQLHETLVIHDPDQETNDLAKGLTYCQQNSLKNIVVLGAFGRRADHFLTNIYVLKLFAPTCDILLMHDDEIAFMCPLKKDLHFSNMKNAYLSLFPLDASVGPITLSGVDYPLASEFLSLDRRVGTLNKINSDRANLYCENGPLLVIVPRQ